MCNRFSFDQLRRLGHNSYYENFKDGVPFCSLSECVGPEDSPLYGQDSFLSLLDTYCHSFVDGSLPNWVNPSVSDNAPLEVREFFAAISQKNMAALMAAPDDDVAFDTIIPRDSSYAQYRSRAREVIRKYSSLYNESKSNSSE